MVEMTRNYVSFLIPDTEVLRMKGWKSDSVEYRRRRGERHSDGDKRFYRRVKMTRPHPGKGSRSQRAEGWGS